MTNHTEVFITPATSEGWKPMAYAPILELIEVKYIGGDKRLAIKIPAVGKDTWLVFMKNASGVERLAWSRGIDFKQWRWWNGTVILEGRSHGND